MGLNDSFTPYSKMTVYVMVSLILVLYTLANLISSSGANDLLDSRELSQVDDNAPLPPLFPLRIRDYLGFLSTAVVLVLASGGGIGGGGVIVPIDILILDFPVKQAIPLASLTVLGGSIANNILNAKRSHPNHPELPVIDWDLILQLEPMTIVGAQLGALFNHLLPEIVLVVLLALLLSFTAFNTLKIAIHMHQKEQSEIDAEPEEELGLLTHDDMESFRGDLKVFYGTTDSGRPVIPEQRQVAWKAALKLSALFIVVNLITIFHGGQVLIYVVVLFFAFLVRRDILERIRSDGQQITSSVAWNESNTIEYPALAVIAGLVAGLFGVGGGIIKGPLMLALGVHPAVASASSACMILFTSSTASVSYALFGQLAYDYAIVCFSLGLVATLIGQNATDLLMKRYRKNSLIVFSIGIVVALSAVFMTLESVLAVQQG